MGQVITFSRVRPAMVSLVGVIFLWAGIAKLLAPLEFARVCAFLLSISPNQNTTAIVVAVGVAVIEVAAGGAIILRLSERRALWIALVAVGGFSVALAVLVVAPNAPGCGCFGGLTTQSGRIEAGWGLARNASLAAMLLLLLCPTAACERIPLKAPHSSGHRAFTLIELLVVILVIAVILALALPALRSARQTARMSERLQLVRQLAAGLDLYCQAHAEMFPYFATPGDPLGPIVVQGAAVPSVYFRSQRWFWASAVVPDYFDADRSSIESAGTAESLRQSGYPESIVASTYQITSTVFAAPRYWREGPSAEWDRSEHYRATKLSDVAFASRKGLIMADLTGSGGYGDPSAFPVALADGSAFAKKLADFHLDRAVQRPHGSTGFPVEATEDGLGGWDF